MTSSNKPFSEHLLQNDFAEMAAERKRRDLISQKEEQDRIEKEEAEQAEAVRIAALPKITDEDLAAAEKKGYEQGVVDGANQTQAELSNMLDARFGEMQKKISDIEPFIQSQLADMQQASLKLVNAILIKIIKHASKKYNTEVLEYYLTEAINLTSKEANLIVSVSPGDKDFIKKCEKTLFKGLNVTVEENSAYSQGDCTIQWDNNGIDARVSSIIAEVEKIVDAASNSIKPENIDLDFMKVAEETRETKLENTEPEENQVDETVEADAEEEKEALETAPSEDKSEPEEKSEENASEDVTNEDKKIDEVDS